MLQECWPLLLCCRHHERKRVGGMHASSVLVLTWLVGIDGGVAGGT